MALQSDQTCEDAPGRYCAYALDDPGGRLHGAPEAKSFAEAALIFTEVWHPPADEAGEVAIMVIDKETGEQQCFTVDLGSGDAEPCS